MKGLQCLLSACLGSVAVGKPMAYPEGMRPGMQMSGASGEFFRYTSVFVKPPDDDDRAEAIEMGNQVQCEVCELILGRLMLRVESNSEDHIMDQLEAFADPGPPSDNEQENRVAKFKKSCNKHFKDEVLMKGHFITRCKPGQFEDADGQPTRTWCLDRTESPVQERDTNTYSNRNEGVFYACEHTIAKYGSEIAAFMSSRLDEGGFINETVPLACSEAARCAGARKIGAAGKAERKAQARKEKASRKTKEVEVQKKKKPQKEESEDEGGESWMEIAARDEDMKKKRRRKGKKVHTEL